MPGFFRWPCHAFLFVFCSDSLTGNRHERFGLQADVVSYFKHKHGIEVRYPELPCLQLGNPGNCVPLEFVTVMGGGGFTLWGVQILESNKNPEVFQMNRLPLTSWLYLILLIVFVNDSIQITIVAFEFWASLFRRSCRSTVLSFFFCASEIHPLVAESAGEHNLEVGKLRTEFQVEVPQQFSFRLDKMKSQMRIRKSEGCNHVDCLAKVFSGNLEMLQHQLCGYQVTRKTAMPPSQRRDQIEQALRNNTLGADLRLGWLEMIYFDVRSWMISWNHVLDFHGKPLVDSNEISQSFCNMMSYL